MKDLKFREEFDGFEECVESILSRGPSKLNDVASNSSYADKFRPGTEGNAEWDLGVGSIPDYRDLARSGWKEGSRKMRDTVGLLALPKAKSVKRKTAWGEEGSEVDIDRMMRGEVDVMWRTAKRTLGGGQRAHFKVVVNCAAACSHKADEFFWRGATACVVADALEEAGYRVEIDLYSYWTDMLTSSAMKEPDYFLSVVVKRYDEALDIARVAALTAHPAFLRTLSFSHPLVLEKDGPTSWRGHPIHTEPTADARQSVFGLPEKYVDPGDIVIDGVWDRAGALALLKQIEQRFN